MPNIFQKRYSSTLRAPADPICTLRIYTFLVFSLLAQQAPCECSHPGWGGPRGRRALRARTGGRALRARGPFGPLGPFGAQGGRLYATKAMPNGIDNTRRKHFRMESIQAEENVRKIKQQQIRVRSMYARDTYTNSQAGAVSSACRSGSKEDPRLLRGEPRYILVGELNQVSVQLAK